jgi:hypothetical protein
MRGVEKIQIEFTEKLLDVVFHLANDYTLFRVAVLANPTNYHRIYMAF